MLDSVQTDSIRCGIAGWDYADWVGTVYPRRIPKEFDRLKFVSQFVDIIEVNASFYRVLAPQVVESWISRTAHNPRLLFSAKSHRCWTHDSAWDPVAAQATLESLRPLLDAGRFAALLIQFPQSFRFSPTARERLLRIQLLAAGWPLCLELRHTSWDTPEAQRFLAELSIPLCMVDQPIASRSSRKLHSTPHGSFAYLRLHGRNQADWFREGAGRDARYNYLYSAAEIASIRADCGASLESTPSAFVVQNNHFRGQALVNALQWQSIWDEVSVEAPEELLLTYPQIESFAHAKRTRLF